MAVRAEFDLGDLGVVSPFAVLQAAGEDLTPLMDAIGRVLVAGAQERIAVSNTDPDGIAWPESLRVRETGGRTLRDQGHLLASITSAPEARQVTIGSNLIYAGIHQVGGTIRAKGGGGLHFTLANGEEVVVGSVTIPARPYLGISTAEAEDIGDLTAAHFSGERQ